MEKWSPIQKQNFFTQAQKQVKTTEKQIITNVFCCCWLLKRFLTIHKLNVSIKLEEQPKLPNRHKTLPGLAGNATPACDSLEALRFHEGSRLTLITISHFLQYWQRPSSCASLRLPFSQLGCRGQSSLYDRACQRSVEVPVMAFITAVFNQLNDHKHSPSLCLILSLASNLNTACRVHTH